MSKTNLADLTADERKELMREALELERQEKQQKEADKKAFKDLSADFVTKHIDALVKRQERVENHIKILFEDYKAILDLKGTIYGEDRVNQDSHTCTLPDGSASIKIGYNVTIGFDGTETAGVEMIKEFINSLAGESENVKKLKKMVDTFLQPNVKTGMLNPVKIIELSKLRDEFNSDKFNEGLQIIFDAQQRRQNSMYVQGFKMIEIDGLPKKFEFRFSL